MPTRDIAPNGAPTWIDVMTSDPSATQAFYSDLFGWTVVDPGPEYGGYFNFYRDGVQVAGGMSNADDHDTGNVWSVAFATPDIAATVKAAEANGGTVYVRPMSVGHLGTMASIAGPGGGTAGLWQSAEHKGFGVLLEPGAPNWFELHTRAYDQDLEFYRQVLGWNTEVVVDDGGFRYSMAVNGEAELAGVMDASVFPDDAPLGWSIYFGTDDIDASVAKALALGATQTLGPDDTPYGILVGMNDPTGAAFKLQQPPAEG